MTEMLFFSFIVFEAECLIKAKGHARIARLAFIGEYGAPPESKDAIRLAIQFVKEETLDVKRYIQLVKLAGFEVDEEWISKTIKAVKERTAKLESDLREYKASHIKESVRVRNLII